MANPHAPTFKAKSADFGNEPGEGSGNSDGMFFAKRKRRSNGMFYSADGAGKSTAGQDTDAEAGKIDHALDELTDIKHRKGYASLHKEATFSSASKAGTVGALVGAAAGFAGGMAAADEKNKKQLEEAMRRARGSEAGQAVDSARETFGHIGRAGADAVMAAKDEIDKRAAAFDELEKAAGFLSMPGKGAVGKAVLRGLGYGGLGVGALGMAAGAGGKSPLVDMQSGKVNPDSSAALSGARDTFNTAKRTYFPGSKTEAPEDAQHPIRAARVARDQKEWSAAKRDGAVAAKRHRERNDPAKKMLFGLLPQPGWIHREGNVLPRPGFPTKGQRRAEAAGAADVESANRRGGDESVYSGLGQEGVSGIGRRALGTAEGEYQRMMSGGDRSEPSSGSKPSSGSEPSARARAAKPRAAAEAAAMGELRGPAEAPAQKPSLPSNWGPGGNFSATQRAGRAAAAEAARAESDAWYGARADEAAARDAEPGTSPVDWDQPEPRSAGRAESAAVAESKPRTKPRTKPKAAPVAVAPTPTPAETLPKQMKGRERPPYGIETARGPKPRTSGLPPGAQYAIDNDLPLTRDEEALRRTPAAEGPIAGPGAMIADRGPLPAPDIGSKRGVDEAQMAETQFGTEVDKLYPDVDAAQRRELIRMASNGELRGRMETNMNPGGYVYQRAPEAGEAEMSYAEGKSPEENAQAYNPMAGMNLKGVSPEKLREMAASGMISETDLKSMLPGRGKPGGTGEKPDTDQLALADSRWGEEIDKEFPGLNPEQRQQMLAVVMQQGGLPDELKAGREPGTPLTGYTGALGSPRYDEMSPLADLKSMLPGRGNTVAGR